MIELIDDSETESCPGYIQDIKEEIIESIKKFHKKHGRAPKMHEFTRKDGYSGRYAVQKYFGNWNNGILPENISFK